MHTLTGRISDKLLLMTEISTLPVAEASRPLDRAYVVTLGLNPHILNVVQQLRTTAKEVVILTTLTTEVVRSIEHPNLQLVHFTSQQHAEIDRYRSSDNPSKWFAKSFDIPSKRNFAVRESKRHQLRYVGIFDDDIFLAAGHLSSGIAALIDGAAIASLYSLWFPDVSTIDIIRSRVRRFQPDVAISGNAMFLNPTLITGFFPYVYNEDWLFFLENLAQNRSVRGVGVIRQQPRKRVSNERVRFEQFGEIIARGIEACCKKRDLRLPDSTDFWRVIFEEYLLDIRDLLRSPALTKQDIAHLKIAADALNCFSIEDVIKFAISFNLDCRNDSL